MHVPLMDITDRIAEPPIWWLNGVPRYCDYHPRDASLLRTQLLVRVCCEYCRRVFDTGIGTMATLKVGVVEPVFGYPVNTATDNWIEEAFDHPPYHLRENGYRCDGSNSFAEWVAILQVWEWMPKGASSWQRRFDLDGPSPNCPI